MKNFLKQMRAKRGVTQEQLALGVGIARQTVINIEGNKFNPKTRTALLFAKYLSCKVEDIFRL